MNRRNIIITAMLFMMLTLLPAPPAGAKGVVLNFSDVDISTMVKFISDLTGKNFIMDDRVKGKISIFSPSKLSNEEAFNVFTSVLELKGFTVVQSGRVYKVLPTSEARQSGMRILTGEEKGPVNDSYVARVITLENISSQEAMPLLQPMVSRDGYINSFGGGNMLLVVDTALNIQKLLDILKLMDTERSRGNGEVVFLKNASADSTADMIREWMGSRDKNSRATGQTAQGVSSAAGGLVIPDTRLNALVLFGSDKDKVEIKKLIDMIDVIPPTSSSKVNVYYLENADAEEVAKVLDGVVKGSQAAAKSGTTAANAAPQQSPFDAGKITITPDKATNSLVIMASPTDYQNLLQVVQKLDKRRRQVFVQALIAEISLDRLKDLGLEWGLIGAASDGKYASVVGQYDPQGTISSILSTLSTSGLSNLVTIPKTGTPANFAALLHALQANGAVNVLSTPNILTSDNKEAEIFVGQNVPFITGTNLSSTGLSQQSVERKDVGIDLKITPQISEGEYVKLDLYQEISAVVPTAVSTSTVNASDLVTTKRSAKTSVLVKDKETVVIGGLIQDQVTESEKKIPLLGDIPGLGWLFKTKNKQRTKTNLLIVLTPRIIRGAEEMAEVSGAQKEKFGNAIRSDRPFNVEEEMQLRP